MMPPLPLAPLYRRSLWGGRRFATVFGRPLPPGDDYAESWELVDRGPDQSVVAAGPLAGTALGELVRVHGEALLGRHAPLGRFPLLFKFLDASRDLSVQVHPDDARAARLDPPDRGKTEAWYVVDALPGSRIYAGLRAGVTGADLRAAIEAGRCADLLHAFEPRPGDCVFIPAGTVHALGAGLLVAEIQQSSDVTYRLYDWDRLGPDGRARPLQIEAGLEAVTRFEPVSIGAPAPTADPAVRRLVTSDFFLFEEVLCDRPWVVGGDDRCHFLTVLAGEIQRVTPGAVGPLERGASLLVPAAAGRVTLEAVPAPVAGPAARLLHVCLP